MADTIQSAEQLEEVEAFLAAIDAHDDVQNIFAGLAGCYAAGLPFLRGTMIGDWAFMAMFVAVVILVKNTSQERLGWVVASAKA